MNATDLRNEPLTPMTAHDFLGLGVNAVAFVRPSGDGSGKIQIHAADGTLLTTVDNRDVAHALVRQNNMEPVSVH